MKPRMKRANCMLLPFFLMVSLATPGIAAKAKAAELWQLKLLTAYQQKNLVWQLPQGRELILQAPSLSLGGKGKTAERAALKMLLVSYRVQDERARFSYEFVSSAHGVRQRGEYTVIITVTSKGEQAVLTQDTALRFAHPLRSDLAFSQVVRVTGKPTLECVLPLRDGVVKTFPLAEGIRPSGYFFLGHGSTSKEGDELALPLIGLDFDYTPGGSFAIATDPYWGSQFQVQVFKKGAQTGCWITTSYANTGSIVPVTEQQRTEVFVYHKAGVDGMLKSFYETIPEIHPNPQWIQGIQLDYYDYISSYHSEPGQGWYHDVQKLAEVIPQRDRGKVVLCLHGYYDYLGRYCYDDATRRLVEKWDCYDKDGRTVPMSLAEMHRRIKFATDRGFHVLLYFGDGTATDTSSPYYRNDWVIRFKNGSYPARGFVQWRPGLKVQIPPSHELPANAKLTNHIMDPAIPAVHDWFVRYTEALLKEYGGELDGFVWDETFLIPRGWVSYARPQPTYSDRAFMRLVSDLTQEVQQWRRINPNLVLLVSDSARVPYALVANGTYEDSECAPQIWAPEFLINYRNSLWSCLWYCVRLDNFNRFAVETYGLAQGLANGWGDNLGRSEMPEGVLNGVIQRFLARIRRGGDRTRYLLTTAPPISYY